MGMGMKMKGDGSRNSNNKQSSVTGAVPKANRENGVTVSGAGEYFHDPDKERKNEDKYYDEIEEPFTSINPLVLSLGRVLESVLDAIPVAFNTVSFSADFPLA